MIKILLAFVLAIAAGIGAGYLFFSFEASTTPEPFYEGQWASTTSKGDNYSAKLTVDRDFVDLGEMKANKKHEATIEISNEGLAMLQVWLDADPPRTMETNFAKMRQFPLGQNESKTLEISATPIQTGGDYRKVLILKSSDLVNSPKQLTVVGQVVGGVIADKQILTHKLKAEAEPVQLKIFSFEHDEITIEDVQFSQEDPKEFCDISYAKMSAEELSTQEGAKSGQIMTINISSELPRNVRRINMKLVTSAEGYSPIDFIIAIAK